MQAAPRPTLRLQVLWARARRPCKCLPSLTLPGTCQQRPVAEGLPSPIPEAEAGLGLG